MHHIKFVFCKQSVSLNDRKSRVAENVLLFVSFVQRCHAVQSVLVRNLCCS